MAGSAEAARLREERAVIEREVSPIRPVPYCALIHRPRLCQGFLAPSFPASITHPQSKERDERQAAELTALNEVHRSAQPLLHHRRYV